MKKLMIAMIAGAAVMGTAQAQTMDNRTYVGVGVTTVDHDLAVPGAIGGRSDGWKSSGKVFAGMDVNRMWGGEIGYVDYRSFDRSYTLNGVPQRIEMDGYGVYMAAKATAPVTDKVEIFGKLGLVHNKFKVSGNNAFGDDSDTDPYFGVGAQYNINPQMAVVLEYERLGKSRDFGVKPNAWTLAARWNF